ncbi:hypothetical protein BU25DRAFT_262812 [Macroventuria anomochaeta]|uniref:Uncharacterized protein n=1 Tax=Macroventuria anomochaeta TaxID=301207 RepID=A0ACB6S6W2_9PLEO|nr:uncharacterized protein BU25DRAFT_262812 [Macroventuria anomochaeta]KAF2630005.1 hypothetical protein BU25DRAFT_262812 [Macroventuria anomochaeta]
MLEPKPRQGLERYFFGPRDTARHSKWPHALRMHGSVTPKILLRVTAVGAWAALISVSSGEVYLINVHPIVTTRLGILVGLALKVRSSSAYNRYTEGRKCWSKLIGISTSLARNIWIHVEEQEGDMEKQDLLAKVTSLNMIIAFAVAFKHRIRFEPYIQHSDLYNLVIHMDTLAKSAGTPTVQEKKPGTETRNTSLRQPSPWKSYNTCTPSSQRRKRRYTQNRKHGIQDSRQSARPRLHPHHIRPHLEHALAHRHISDHVTLFVVCLPFQLVHLMGSTSIPRDRALCIHNTGVLRDRKRD